MKLDSKLSNSLVTVANITIAIHHLISNGQDIKLPRQLFILALHINNHRIQEVNL